MTRNNPWAGEVAIAVGGRSYRAKLTLGALAEMEAALPSGNLLDLVERFEAGRFSSRDVLEVLVAGLRGGGEWQGGREDMLALDLGGGPVGAARLAAQLLARAFALPE